MFVIFYQINDVDFTEGGESTDYFRAVFTDLDSAVAECEKELNSLREDFAHDDVIVTVQTETTDEGTVVVQIVDENGEWIEGFLIRPLTLNKLQP